MGAFFSSDYDCRTKRRSVRRSRKKRVKRRKSRRSRFGQKPINDVLDMDPLVFGKKRRGRRKSRRRKSRRKSTSQKSQVMKIFHAERKHDPNFQ